VRRRLFRGIAAALLATVMVVPGGVRPARAVDPATITAITGAVTAAFNIIKGLNSGGLSIEAATRQIIAAINTAQTAIIAEVDRVATAQAKACATRAVIEFVDVERFNPDVMQQWAQDVTGCLTLIDSLISTVQDKSSIDQLGIALDVVGPIAIAARGRVGFSTTTLLPLLRQANTNVVGILAPACSSVVVREPGAPVVEIQHTCTAYNGDASYETQTRYRNGPYQPPTVDTVALGNRATARTSRAVAQSVLPLLVG
jgi:hypothetical protein